MLKTKCKDCIFYPVVSSDPTKKCELEKQAFYQGKEQYVEGYCRHKRIEGWRERVDPDLLEDKDFLFNRINDEEARLSVIIVCLDNDYEKLQNTLVSLNNCKDFVKQIIVVTHKAQGQGFIDVVNSITSFGIPWNIENMKGDYEYSFNDVYDYAANLAKCHWLVGIPAGYLFEGNDLGQIHDLIAYDKNNCVAFYTNDYFVASTFAFHELGGNHQANWLDKVKTFENWEKVCRKVE